MGWNNGALTDKEFLKQACRWADATSVTTASKWWWAFVEVIIRELYYNGSCRIPGLGTFTTKKMGEKIQIQKGLGGREVTYKVPEREVPVFVPHSDMIDDINMQGVTKHYRKKLKAGELTKRDYARQARAESLGVLGSLSEERMEASKEKFIELLEEKKKKTKGKIEVDEKE